MIGNGHAGFGRGALEKDHQGTSPAPYLGGSSHRSSSTVRPGRARLTANDMPMSRPLRSTSTPASRGFTATTSRSASERRDWYSMPAVTAFGTLPLATLEAYDPGRRYQRSPSHVPCKSRRPGSRRLYAGHHLARTRDTRQTQSQGTERPPVSMPFASSRRLKQRTPSTHRELLERLPGPHLTRSSRAFSPTLTTTVFS